MRGSRIRHLARAERVLEKSGGELKCFATEGPKTAGAITRQRIHEGSDLIVVAGGDGTINEAIAGMTGSRTPLGILPAGTANVLANELGLRSHMEAAAGQLFNCVPERISVGSLAAADAGERQSFLLMAGAGLDAHIVLHLDPSMKAKFGKMAYWLCGFGEFGRSLEEFEVTIDGITHLCSFALISKVRNYGGDFEIAREVTLLDDEFEVVLFEGSNSFRYFIYLAGVAGRWHNQIPGVTVFRATEVLMRARNGEKVHLQVDGEYAGSLPAKACIVPDALTLLVPLGYRAKGQSGVAAARAVF